VPVRAVADRLHRAEVQPGQEEQDDDRTAHHHHTPELGVDGQHHDATATTAAPMIAPLNSDGILNRAPSSAARHHAQHQHVHHLGGDGTQHRVERREVPDRRNVQRRLQRVGRDEVVVLQEVAAQLRREEDHAVNTIRNTLTPKMSCTV
jgi:hypothetical protein